MGGTITQEDLSSFEQAEFHGPIEYKTTLSSTKKSDQSLAAKLAEACEAVGGVEKKGRNETQKYNYIKAADIAKAIRHELFQRGIVIIGSESDLIQERITTNNGGTMTEVRLKVTYTVTDGTETLTFDAWGVARDSGDKAIYKAKTGALKYFLRGLGLIPDEKDDPEADESVDKAQIQISNGQATVTAKKAVSGIPQQSTITKKTTVKPAVQKADKQTDFLANAAPASEPVKEQVAKFEASEDDIPDNIGSPKPTQADYNAYGITFRGFGVDTNKIGSYMRKKYNVEKPKDELNKTQWDETVTELKAAFEAKTLTELLQEKK